jgi:hypothetical protein
MLDRHEFQRLSQENHAIFHALSMMTYSPEGFDATMELPEPFQTDYLEALNAMPPFTILDKKFARRRVRPDQIGAGSYLRVFCNEYWGSMLVNVVHLRGRQRKYKNAGLAQSKTSSVRDSYIITSREPQYSHSFDFTSDLAGSAALFKFHSGLYEEFKRLQKLPWFAQHCFCEGIQPTKAAYIKFVGAILDSIHMDKMGDEMREQEDAEWVAFARATLAGENAE